MPYPRLTEYALINYRVAPANKVIRAEINPQAFFEADMTPDARRAGQADRYPSRVGGRKARATFTTELRGRTGSGSAALVDNKLYFHELLQACGFQGSKQAGISYTYALTSDVHLASASGNVSPLDVLAIYYDGLEYSASNAVGTCTYRFPVNEPAKIDWEFIGNFSGNPSEVSNPAVSETTLGAPLVCTGATLTLESVTLVYRSLEIALGNVLTHRPDIASSYGYQSPLVSRREVRFTAEIEAPELATQNVFTWFDNRTPITLSFTLGTVGGNTVTFSGDFVLDAMPELIDLDGVIAGYRLVGALEPSALFTEVWT